MIYTIEPCPVSFLPPGFDLWGVAVGALMEC